MRISLDTNIFIFGLRNIDPFSATIMKNLFCFDIRLSVQVEKELRQNFTHSELRQFYKQIEPLPAFQIVYQLSEEKRIDKYRKLGLKTGDAKIAAFCEQEKIRFLVSENRHFLRVLSKRPCQVLDSKGFCEIFSLR